MLKSSLDEYFVRGLTFYELKYAISGPGYSATYGNVESIYPVNPYPASYGLNPMNPMHPVSPISGPLYQTQIQIHSVRQKRFH